MDKKNSVPVASYGVLDRTFVCSEIDEAVEQVKNIGYAILSSGYSETEILSFISIFDRTREQHVEFFGAEYLKSLDEFNNVRSPMVYGDDFYINLALNDKILSVIDKLIFGKFILNQQNCLVNPSRESYNQGAWHRDLPYQHFTSSSPMAINALFCIDDFTTQNGATYVLPASHKLVAFPSQQYINKNAVQIEAPAGSFIVMDCMLFHSGGFNSTEFERRAINHVFTVPYFKQQINIPKNIPVRSLTELQREILGFRFMEPQSITEYFQLKKRN